MAMIPFLGASLPSAPAQRAATSMRVEWGHLGVWSMKGLSADKDEFVMSPSQSLLYLNHFSESDPAATFAQ